MRNTVKKTARSSRHSPCHCIKWSKFKLEGTSFPRAYHGTFFEFARMPGLDGRQGLLIRILEQPTLMKYPWRGFLPQCMLFQLSPEYASRFQRSYHSSLSPRICAPASK